MNNVHSSPTRIAVAFLLAMATVLPFVGTPDAGARRAADTQTEVDGPNILVNGGFERGADPGQMLILQPGTPYLDGWTIESPSPERQVYYVGSGWQAAEGTRSVGFRLSQYWFNVKKQTADIKQTFATTVGQRYHVSFYQAVNAYRKNVPMILRMMVGGQTRDYTYQSDMAATPQHMEWVKRTFVFTATTANATIEFAPHYTTFDDGPLLGLDNVQVRAIQAASPTPTPVPSTGTPQAVSATTTTLTLAAPTLAAAGQQTVTVTTGNGAAVALVIDYPDGSQLVVPARADTTGHYAYTWTVPSTVHGTVKVIAVDGAGTIVRSSFTVS